jgi:hypothetical protein
MSLEPLLRASQRVLVKGGWLWICTRDVLFGEDALKTGIASIAQERHLNDNSVPEDGYLRELEGEQGVGIELGVGLDTRLTKPRDTTVDFMVGGLSLDVRTVSGKGEYLDLPLSLADRCADIVILARRTGQPGERGVIVGWTERAQLLASPVVRLSPGVEGHCIDASALYPLVDLKVRLGLELEALEYALLPQRLAIRMNLWGWSLVHQEVFDRSRVVLGYQTEPARHLLTSGCLAGQMGSDVSLGSVVRAILSETAYDNANVIIPFGGVKASVLLKAGVNDLLSVETRGGQHGSLQQA